MLKAENNFNGGKVCGKMAQIPATLTWFIGFLIIFFVMLMFIFFTLLATASREIDVQPMDWSSVELEVQRDLMVFLNSPVEIDGKEKRIIEVISSSLDPYFELEDQFKNDGKEMSLIDWSYGYYSGAPDSLEKMWADRGSSNPVGTFFEDKSLNEIMRNDLDLGKQLSQELDKFCNKYYLQLPQGVVKPGGMSTKLALGNGIFDGNEDLWTPTIKFNFLYKGKVFEIQYRQLRICEKTDLIRAEDTLKEIINALEGNWAGQFKDIEIDYPEGWRILSYPEKGLVCVCPRPKGGGDKESQFALCETDGVCKEVNVNFEIDSYCAPASASILNCYSLTDLPLELVIEKKGDSYQLKSKEQAEAGGIFEQLLEYKGDEAKSVEELFKDLSDNLEDVSVQSKVRSQLDKFLKEGKGYDWQLQVREQESSGIFMSSFDTKEFTIDNPIGEAESIEIENSQGKKYVFYLNIMTIKKKDGTFKNWGH